MAKKGLASKLQLRLDYEDWEPDPSLLLHPNVPKPLHGLAPRVVLGVNWWNKERRECYKSCNFHCKACGVHKTDAKYHKWLEAHETYEIDYQRGIAKYICTVPLCHFCHCYIHDGRLQALLDQGKLHHAKYTAIIQHGDEVLSRGNLARPTHAEREAMIGKLLANGRIAEWSKWRLVIGRKKYKPLHRSEAEYIKAYSGEDNG